MIQVAVVMSAESPQHRGQDNQPAFHLADSREGGRDPSSQYVASIVVISFHIFPKMDDCLCSSFLFLFLIT